MEREIIANYRRHSRAGGVCFNNLVGLQSLEMGDEVKMQKETKWIVRLILLMVLWAAPAPGWGANTVCYVSTSGAAGNDGLTPSTPKALPSQAAGVVVAQVPTTGHTIYIESGSYTDSLSVTNDNNNNGLNILGVKSLSTLQDASKGDVVITNTGGTRPAIIRRPATIKNISITGTGLTTQGLYLTNSGAAGLFLVDNIYIYNVGSDTALYVTSSGAGGNALVGTIQNSIFAGSNANYVVLATSAGDTYTLTLQTSIVKNSGSLYASNACNVYNAGPGTFNIKNCDIGGGLLTATQNNHASGTLNLINNILAAGNALNSSYCIYKTAGTVNASSNLLIGNFGSSFNLVFGALDTDSNNIETWPRFVRHARSGFFIPNMDDISDTAAKVEYAGDVAALLRDRGMKGNIFLTGNNLAYGTYDYASNVTDLISDGTISISIHAYTHAPLNMTTFGTMTHGGATFTVNRTTNTITTSDSSVTVTGFKTKTIGDIKTEMESGGWVVTLEADASNNRGIYNHGEILADGTGNNLTLLLDTTNTGSSITGYFKDQIWDWSQWLNTNLGVTITTVGGPGGITCAASEAAIKNMGFIANRNWAAGDTKNLSSINIYKTTVLQSESIRNDSAVADTILMAEWMSTFGTLLHFNSHSTADTTLAAWASILDTLQAYSEIQVTDFATAAAYIRDSGLWTTADNITYTRTFTDQSDFHILAGGPGIDTGTATGLGANFLDYDGIAMTDGAGNALGAGVDIGCYTFAGHGANGPGQLGPGLMIENISPLELLGFRYAALGAYEFQGH